MHCYLILKTHIEYDCNEIWEEIIFEEKVILNNISYKNKIFNKNIFTMVIMPHEIKIE